MSITSSNTNIHMRIYTEFAEQIQTLNDEKKLTAAAIKLLALIPAQHWDISVPVQLNKEEWLELTGTNVTQFSRDYKCLKDHGIWKKIKSNYVISPAYIFNGDDNIRLEAIKYFNEDKPFSRVTASKLSKEWAAIKAKRKAAEAQHQTEEQDTEDRDNNIPY